MRLTFTAAHPAPTASMLRFGSARDARKPVDIIGNEAELRKKLERQGKSPAEIETLVRALEHAAPNVIQAAGQVGHREMDLEDLLAGLDKDGEGGGGPNSSGFGRLVN